MKEKEFRSWLKQKQISTVSNRMSLVRRVERALPSLGFSASSLDEMHAANTFQQITEKLQELAQTTAAAQAVPVLLPSGSANPHGRFSTLLAATRNYKDFLDGKPPTPISAPEEEGLVRDEKSILREIRAERQPTNLILYGPPGTGKTYATVAKAIELCDDYVPQDREFLMERYNELVATRQIKFVTFHQSYSYEDFIEGLRPTTGNDEDEDAGSTAGFRLNPHPGVLREIAAEAEQARKSGQADQGLNLEHRRFFKMSLGRAGFDEVIYEAALKGGYITLGYGGEIDWSDPKYDNFEAIRARWIAQPGEEQTTGRHGNIAQTWCFRSAMKDGDLIVVSEGNSRFRAIAEVAGPYRFVEPDDAGYPHRRRVRWLLKLDESLPAANVYDGGFARRTCYQLQTDKVNWPGVRRLLGDEAEEPGGVPDQFVLIIDEINRANVSKVFGELITLIEPDKRLGMPEALTVTLPYSGLPFGLPSNLHLIGTMNTADRSIALLDTALRRRFSFCEVMPEPELLREASAHSGVNLVKFLSTLNRRIEYILGREQQIGHAFFIKCRSRSDVDLTMREKVIPLLQEYFFEDWGKVAAVLGDGLENPTRFMECSTLPVPPGVEDPGDVRLSWRVRDIFAEHAYTP